MMYKRKWVWLTAELPCGSRYSEVPEFTIFGSSSRTRRSGNHKQGSGAMVDAVENSTCMHWSCILHLWSISLGKVVSSVKLPDIGSGNPIFIQTSCGQSYYRKIPRWDVSNGAFQKFKVLGFFNFIYFHIHQNVQQIIETFLRYMMVQRVLNNCLVLSGWFHRSKDFEAIRTGKSAIWHKSS